MQYSDWHFTGDIYDHPAKDISCDLCAHERLRYEHIIQNTKTQEKKSVGSSCILKFAEIAVYDEQGRVTTNSAEREQALKKAFQRFKFELSLVPLRELYRVMFEADQRKLANIVEFVKEKGSFPPNDLVWVFSSMKDRGIGYNPGLYKVFSRDVSSQVDLKMAVQEPLKLDRIYHSLSASQKKTCGISEKPEGSGGG